MGSRILAVDTETGGTGHHHALLEIGAVYAGERGEVLARFVVKLFPHDERAIDPASLPYNGYSRAAWARAGAVAPEHGLWLFHEWAGGLGPEPLAVVGHNLPFDERFLCCAYGRFGWFPSAWSRFAREDGSFPFAPPAAVASAAEKRAFDAARSAVLRALLPTATQRVDTLPLAKVHLVKPGRTVDAQLGTVRRALGVHVAGPEHSALPDAERHLGIYLALRRELGMGAGSPTAAVEASP